MKMSILGFGIFLNNGLLEFHGYVRNFLNQDFRDCDEKLWRWDFYHIRRVMSSFIWVVADNISFQTAGQRQYEIAKQFLVSIILDGEH